MEVDALGGVEHEQVGGVGAGLALTGQCGLGADIDHRALAGLESWHALMNQLVIVGQVAVKRLLELTP